MLKIDVRPYVICIVASMFMASSALAVPTNGTFSIPDLSGWTVEPLGATITDGGGFAFFEESPDFSPSSLITDQPFIIPVGALELSFKRIMNSSGTPDTDTFTVSLLDELYNPLISYDPYDPGITWFYSLDSSGDEFMVPSASVVGNTVTLDISSFIGQDVLLAFDFFSENDGWTTTVELDNVNVSVIPAPAALVLGFIGTGLVSLLRRTKTIT